MPGEYRARQAELAAQSTGVGAIPCEIAYRDGEHQTWARAQKQLVPIWERYAARELVAARQQLGLPQNEIPQLSLVSERVFAETGFRFASVPGTVSGLDFFGALAKRVFPSTQFIRWSGDPGYTPEPDVLHEIGGHAHSLMEPRLAELHQLAGRASIADPAKLSEIAAAFWYSIEFGVVAATTDTAHGPKAYGAGLLSSPGELGWFAEHADIRPLDIDAMLATPYDIHHFQPVLFCADSLDHVLDEVGGYFHSIISQPTPPRPKGI